MKVRRLGETFFAEVTDVDLARLDDGTFAEVRKAHLDHGVVVFRDQDLTPEQHIAFSARFGPLQVHPIMQFNLEGAPEILMVSSDRHPDEGGDTMFCDMTAACRDLPADKRELLLKAKAIHHFASRWSRESKAGMR